MIDHRSFTSNLGSCEIKSEVLCWDKEKAATSVVQFLHKPLILLISTLSLIVFVKPF